MQMLRNGLQKLHPMQSSGRQHSILQQGREMTGMMGNLWGCCQMDRNSARRQPSQRSRMMVGRQTRTRKLALQQQHLVLTRTAPERRQRMIVGQMQRWSNAGQMRTVLTPQQQRRSVRSAGQMHSVPTTQQLQSMSNRTRMMTAGQMQSALTRQQRQKRVRSLQQMQQQQQLNWTQRSLNLRYSLSGMGLQQYWETTQCQQQCRHGQVASSSRVQSQAKVQRTGRQRSKEVAHGWQRLPVKLLPSRAMSTLQVWTL
jgi:hypothetical protein